MGHTPGQVINRTLRSYELVREMRLCIYLPPLYGSFSMRYPVLYLLHPWGADECFWAEQLRIHEAADHLIHAGALPPFIAVMPQGDKSFFIDAAQPGGDFTPITRLDPTHFAGALEGCGDYGSFLLNDVIPFIEGEYTTRSNRGGRAIAGVEMGAAGAAVLAFSHPALFSTVGIHSPTLFSNEHLGPPWIFGLGDESSFAPRDPLHLARELNGHVKPRILVDSAQDDDSYLDTHTLHVALDVRKITHTYRTHPGRSTPGHWREHLAEYLGFYAAGW